MLRISYFWPDWNSYGRLWVCSTLFSVQEVTFLFFPPKSLSQILEILSIRSMSRTCYQPTIDTAVIGKKTRKLSATPFSLNPHNNSSILAAAIQIPTSFSCTLRYVLASL